MIPFTEEAPGVFAFSLYDFVTCESIVERLKVADGWESAGVREGDGEGGYRNLQRPEVRTASVLAGATAVEVVREFEERIDGFIKPLIRDLWGVTLTKHAGTQIIRYGIGGHFDAHADAGYDLQERYFSVLCYLNDDYEGGSTSFASLRYSTTPRRGKAVIFPSRYLHCAEPVTVGEKYVLLSWVNGPVPIKWI
ncbi:MAG: prolyl hydroxylase family protein [Pyrinomonadaceae bacterium]